MIKRGKSEALILVMTSLLFFSLSCKKQSNNGQDTSTLPPFNDPVPYSTLGQGKLVFERLYGYNGIYVIDIDKQRTYGISGGVMDAPAVSPDGNMIAYNIYGSKTLYIMNIDGTNRRLVTDLAGKEYCPSWTFDGTQILFSLDRFYTNTNLIEALYRQSPVPNPSDRSQIIDYNTIDPPSIFFGVGTVSSSLNGKLVLSADGIRTFDSDGSNMKLIIPTSQNNDHMMCSPKWSPDGNKIAVLSYKMNSDISVVLFNPDGSKPDTLISLTSAGPGGYGWLGADNVYSLCWSPDGSQIAFTRPEGSQNGVESHIYVIKKNHTGLTQVTFAAGVSDFSLSWSH